MRDPSLPDVLGLAACAAALGLLLLAAGRPVATDDLWWHLALGRSFASEGPWLDDDPLLFTSPHPASSASWLADLSLAGVERTLGFYGLRAAAVAAVAAIAALAGGLLRRESGSTRFACAALVAFTTLAAYRVFQLRPHLFTLLATLVLYRVALRPRDGPGPAAIALCALGMGLWANLHAGFVLGPALVAAAALGVLGHAALAVRLPDARERTRLRRLATLAAAGGLATLVNPGGLEPHLAYFSAGAETPALGRVLDEWAPFEWLALPRATPPSPASWAIVWALVLATLGLTLQALRTARRAGPDEPPLDPALVAIAWLSLLAIGSAVRFLWLGIFPLLLVAQAVRARPRDEALRMRWPLALASVALLAAFVTIGPWTRIGNHTPWRDPGWAEPYSAWKYYAEAIWLMRDAGLEGRLYTDYHVGGFAGFWLAPRIRTFVNGSLNVPPEVMRANRAIRDRRGLRAGESFAELLDRFELDLFHGIHFPRAELSQVEFVTTGHLERTPGWIPIFRNARSALYLRARAGNAANLRRVAEHYAREGVPFGPQRGFEPARVVRERPDWAVRHGLVPADFAALHATATSSADTAERIPALGLVATWFALLGAYDEAIALDEQILARLPREHGPRRRLAWSLLRAGRIGAAARHAASLDTSDPVARAIADTARRAAETRRATGSLPPETETRIRNLPLLTPEQARWIVTVLEGSPPRH